MTELQRTGFFREMPHGEPSDPSLADARSAAAGPHQDRIAAYLDAGHVYIATPGYTHDVFDAGRRIGPPHYLTDGRFLWPGDLAHYVRTYHVRLAAPFIEHMMASGWTVPADVDLATLSRPAAKAPNASDTSDASPDLAALLADFLGAAKDSFAGERGAALRAQLSAVGGAASRLLDAITPKDAASRERIAAEGEKLRQALEGAGADVARAAETLGDDLRRVLEDASGKARTRATSTLRSITDWLEKPEEERAAEARAMMTSLEAKLEEAFAPQRAAEKAERDKRLGTEVRSSIADRLRERGVDPSKGSDPPRDDDDK